MSQNVTRAYRDLIQNGDISADEGQDLIVSKLQNVSDALLDYTSSASSRGLFGLGSRRAKAPQGLYIYGGVGRGKSMLMDLFFDHIPIESKLRVHFHEFMQSVHEKIHTWRQAYKAGQAKGEEPIGPVAEELLGKHSLLCFDEFHVTDITDAMILGRLFDVFYEMGVVIIATSNRHPDDLYENGLNRQLFVPFIERLKSNMDVLALDGAHDYRLERISGGDVFYTPLGKKAEKAMQASWERLTNQETGAPEKLQMKGRELDVPQSAMGVARFDFKDICDTALGPADYLRIAHHYHTVMIDNIPTLTSAERNQAKRFVTLIDALYESKTKLIASSAGEAEKIYQQGDGKFEFGRTFL